jgi:hypothetical protein
MPAKICGASMSIPRPKQSRRHIGARLAALAMAAVAGILMYQGERWVLEVSSAAPDASMIAACAIEVAAAGGPPTRACPREPIQ